LTPADLSRWALRLRSANQEINLRELLGPAWYHRDLGPVYSFGGAFVDFLIRSRGTKKFLRLYNECRPGSFEAVIRDVYELDIDALEAEFWKDAVQQGRRTSGVYSTIHIPNVVRRYRSTAPYNLRRLPVELERVVSAQREWCVVAVA